MLGVLGGGPGGPGLETSLARLSRALSEMGGRVTLLWDSGAVEAAGGGQLSLSPVGDGVFMGGR